MNRLKEVRQQLKLTMWAVAVKSKTTASFICAIEKYNYTPSNFIKKRIADSLNISVDAIWPATDEEHAEVPEIC